MTVYRRPTSKLAEVGVRGVYEISKHKISPVAPWCDKMVKLTRITPTADVQIISNKLLDRFQPFAFRPQSNCPQYMLTYNPVRLTFYLAYRHILEL